MIEFLLVLIAFTIAIGVTLILSELKRGRRDAAIVGILRLFGSALATCAADPRALLTWYPLATSARTMFPNAFDELDRISGGPFPFNPDHLQSAHARWTTEWLTWERNHDAEFRLKAAAAEQVLNEADASRRSVLRAGLEAIERQKLETYQQRYEEYVRVAKALGELEAAMRQDSSRMQSVKGMKG